MSKTLENILSFLVLLMVSTGCAGLYYVWLRVWLVLLAETMPFAVTLYMGLAPVIIGVAWLIGPEDKGGR